MTFCFSHIHKRFKTVKILIAFLWNVEYKRWWMNTRALHFICFTFESICWTSIHITKSLIQTNSILFMKFLIYSCRAGHGVFAFPAYQWIMLIFIMNNEKNYCCVSFRHNFWSVIYRRCNKSVWQNISPSKPKSVQICTQIQ